MQNRNALPSLAGSPEGQGRKLRQRDIAQVRAAGVGHVRQYRKGVAGLEQGQNDLQIVAEEDAAGLPSVCNAVLNMEKGRRADLGTAYGHGAAFLQVLQLGNCQGFVPRQGMVLLHTHTAGQDRSSRQRILGRVMS